MHHSARGTPNGGGRCERLRRLAVVRGSCVRQIAAGGASGRRGTRRQRPPLTLRRRARWCQVRVTRSGWQPSDHLPSHATRGTIVSVAKGDNPRFDRCGAWAGRRPCAGLGTGLLSRTRVVRSRGSTRVAARDLHDSDRGASAPPPRSRSECTRGNGVGLSRSWVRCGLSPSPLWWLGLAQYGGGDRTCPAAVDSVEDVEKTCPFQLHGPRSNGL